MAKSEKTSRARNPMTVMKARSGVALSKFKQNEKGSRAAPQFQSGSGSFSDKIKNRPGSSNVVDKRPKKSDLFTATNSRDDHLRQIFDPKTSKNLTYVSNRVVRADPDHAKGKGMTKLRSPAGKVQYNIFSKSDLKKGK
jgi:hypothetical protein